MRVFACAPLYQSLDCICVITAWDPVVCHYDKYVKHNKTLGLNFLTLDLDLHLFSMYKYCDHDIFFMEIRKHFHMSELANYMAHN